MNEKRLKLLGDTFTLFAFTLPSVFVAFAALTRCSRQWLRWSDTGYIKFEVSRGIIPVTPRGILDCLFILCGLGGMALMHKGRATQRRRVFWQGAFAVCVCITVACTAWVLIEYAPVRL